MLEKVPVDEDEIYMLPAVALRGSKRRDPRIQENGPEGGTIQLRN